MTSNSFEENRRAITLAPERNSLFDEAGLQRLRDQYMRPDEKDPQERFAYVAAQFGSNPAHAQRLYEYASKHWLSFSTPILSFGRSKRSLGISCFLPFIEDTIDGLLEASDESKVLSVYGGGVGLGVNIRTADEKSAGVMAHMKTYEADSNAYKQGTTRRGAYAAYLRVDHPDIFQFINMRKPGGDEALRCAHLNHGIVITDEFMELIGKCMIDPTADDTWTLKDPDGSVRGTCSAKQLWEEILDTRMLTGEPYMMFEGACNRGLCEAQREAGMTVKQSNLCTEITLVTDFERTAVCCLSSLNLVYFDEYQHNYQFFRDVAEMLDNVLTYFIENAPAKMHRAVYSAAQERSIGIGALGFHEYLQRAGVPFESPMAVGINNRIFSTIRQHLDRANVELGELLGAPPDLQSNIEVETDALNFNHLEFNSNAPVHLTKHVDGVAQPLDWYPAWKIEAGDIIHLHGVMHRVVTVWGVEPWNSHRFAHMMAVAPNASSSMIMGNTSPSIEPYRANAYRQPTINGFFFNKNKVLDALIRERVASKDADGMSYDEIWSSIIAHDGSIQHLKKIFSAVELEVFKTAMEIDQRWVIQHAADRQVYIDQAQSVNVFFAPGTPIPVVSYVHFLAWKAGLKTLYYLRTEKASKVTKLGQQVQRHALDDLIKVVQSDEPICIACEG